LTELKTKAVVVGGGPAGLVAAHLLHHQGVDACLVAPETPVDTRTTALMAPSIRLLDKLGVWTEALRAQCCPLKELHMLDDTGNLVQAQDLRLRAIELGLDEFGWNVPLAHLVPMLRENLPVPLYNARVVSAATNDHITLTLDNGDMITAQVAIAADGATSTLRDAAGIKTEQWSFDQHALVCNFSHSGPHHNTSTEFHHVGGLFTTVPLPGDRSAVVWLDKPAEIARLTALPAGELAVEIQLQNHGMLGRVSDVSTPRTFPMRGIAAEKLAARRTILVGEAAHVFPPVGAQGLNMSFRDVGHAVELIASANDPGTDDILAAYNKARRDDIGPRTFAISFVNHTLISQYVAPHVLRALSLTALGSLPALRDYVLKTGLNPQNDLPRLMRG
jgi:2-octaprenyl-6-methoxyphenol hydroxylase